MKPKVQWINDELLLNTPESLLCVTQLKLLITSQSSLN